MYLHPSPPLMSKCRLTICMLHDCEGTPHWHRTQITYTHMRKLTPKFLYTPPCTHAHRSGMRGRRGRLHGRRVIDHTEREQDRTVIHCIHVLCEIWFQKLRDKIEGNSSNAPAAFSGQQVSSQAGNMNLRKVVRRRWSFRRLCQQVNHVGRGKVKRRAALVM
jgi:hypothetical protein